MRIMAAVATLLLVTPAVAADVAPKPDKPAKEKKICRTNQSSSSRLGGRPICKTQAEWDADRQTQQRDLDKMSRDN